MTGNCLDARIRALERLVRASINNPSQRHAELIARVTERIAAQRTSGELDHDALLERIKASENALHHKLFGIP